MNPIPPKVMRPCALMVEAAQRLMARSSTSRDRELALELERRAYLGAARSLKQ